MDNKTIFTKTAKGLREATGKTRVLSRGLRSILKEVDGKSSVEEILDRLGDLPEDDLRNALTELAGEEHIREFVQTATTVEPSEDLDFSSLVPPAGKTEESAGAKGLADILRKTQATQVREDADAKAKIEAQAKKKAEEQARQTAEAQARREAEEKVKQEAAAKARRVAEAREHEKAALQARREAEESLKREIEEHAKREAETRAQREAEEKARREAEMQAKKEAEARAQREAEEKVRREIEEQAQRAAEEEARRKAEELARREAGEQAQREAEARERQEAEERARQEAAEQIRREAEEKARREAEMQAKKEAEARAQREAEEKVRREIKEQAQRAAEEETRREVEEKARRKAGAQAKKEAEAQAKREAKERARQEAEEKARRKAAEKAAAKSDKPIEKKQINWGKTIALGLFVLSALGLGLIHVISFDGQLAQLEKTAADQFRQPVKIGTMHLSLLPQPHWIIEGAVIGEAGQIRADRVKATIELGSVFSGKRAFNLVEFHSLVLNEEGLGWLLFGKPQGDEFRFARASAINARLDSKNINLPAFDVKANIGNDGNWQKILVFSDRGGVVELQPKGNRVQIEINADMFSVPFGSTLALGSFTATGTAGRNDLSLTEFKGRLYGGFVNGTARLKWAAKWSLDGELSARQIASPQVVPELLASGEIEGKGTYALRAADAVNLFVAPHLEGSFIVHEGILLGVDLVSLLKSGGSGGKTSFSELAGNFVQEGNRTQLRQVRLAAGIVSAVGSAEVDANKNIRGRFAANLKYSTGQAHANVAVSGPLKDPHFSR